MANDLTQAAWLRTLEYLRRQGKELPPASTDDELRNQYAQYEGLLYQNVKREARTRRRSDEPLTDVEDHGMMEAVEADATLADLMDDPAIRDAIRTFITAWQMQEKGMPVPRPLRKALVVYRKETGLALELRKGRT